MGNLETSPQYQAFASLPISEIYPSQIRAQIATVKPTTATYEVMEYLLSLLAMSRAYWSQRMVSIAELITAGVITSITDTGTGTWGIANTDEVTYTEAGSPSVAGKRVIKFPTDFQMDVYYVSAATNDTGSDQHYCATRNANGTSVVQTLFVDEQLNNNSKSWGQESSVTDFARVGRLGPKLQLDLQIVTVLAAASVSRFIVLGYIS